jgi:hypothetical protein
LFNGRLGNLLKKDIYSDQWDTENPRVGSSILSPATINISNKNKKITFIAIIAPIVKKPSRGFWVPVLVLLRKQQVLNAD